MRRPYLESASRFVFGLLFLLGLVWALQDGAQVSLAGLAPALKATGVTVGLSTLYALPVALLLAVPAGLRPGGVLDRLLQGATLVLAAVSAVVALLVAGGLLAGTAQNQGREVLAVLVAAPWLARGIRAGMAPAGRGAVAPAIMGRLLQEAGNLVLVTAPLQALFAADVVSLTLPAGLLALALPVLVAHLVGDLLTAGVERREYRIPVSWLVTGGVMVLLFLAAAMLSFGDAVRVDLTSRLLAPGAAGHLLGTDQLGRDVLARLATGARMSLFVAAGATVLATVAGALLAVLGRALGSAAAAILAPKVSVPALLTVGLSSTCVLLFRQPPGLLWMVLILGLASVPPAAYAFRRLLTGPDAGAARGLAGSLFLVMAQVCFGEAYFGAVGLGVQPPAASLGSMAVAGSTFQAQAPHLLLPAVVLAFGIGGLFLVGQALRESDRTDA
ncbi:MAG TPA: hypothetical protein VNT75_25760 [Symbiobacteriaceae bacterium]|nr:hypothetical protein [Symbiobacteriaceae bacterium]